jgi:hypothetical protein
MSELTTEPKLYSTVAPTGFAGARGGLVNFLVPNGGSTNVVNDYTWTLSRPGEIAREEVPYIRLKEYRILRSSLETSAKYYALGIIQQGAQETDPAIAYKGLFDYETETGFEYTFPYFSDINTEVQSTWTTLDILEKIQGATGAISPALQGAINTITNAGRTIFETQYPRVGVMDRPKLWEQSTPRSITIKFPLFNTLKEEDIQKNWELCYLLTYQNMFNKRDLITALPPVYYVVYAPGQYYSPGAYVSDLKIYNKGSIHKILFGNRPRNIPDAFEIEMTLTDMVMPSQNNQSVLQTEEPVKVNGG